MKASKRFCAAVIAALVFGSLLAPQAASAQMQTPPSPPGPSPMVSGPYHPTQGDRVGAGFLNVVYVPGKAILCGAGTLASAGIMLVTFGSAYHAAVEIFNEGCTGQWVLTPYDVAAKRSPDESY
jgi:hypothetical protein